MKKIRKNCVYIVVAILAFTLFSQTAKAESFEWKSDTTGTIWVTADLTISGNTLTIELSNISAADTEDPADVLSSFYFDFVNTNGDSVYPTLSGLISATGHLYSTVIGGDDIPLDTNLLTATDPYVPPPYTDPTTPPWWVAKDMVEGEYPYLGYGIGAVGNSDLNPNNFPDAMDGVNGGIVQNDNIESNNLANKNTMTLVKDTATFELLFNENLSLLGLSIGQVAFGFGSAPESLYVVPVPGAVILGILGLGVVGIKLRKFA